MDWTVLGDPHLKPENIDKIQTLFDIAEELGNPVLILGDLLDTKEVVRSRCLNLVYDRLKRSRLQFTILVGNHDWHNLQCEDHSLRILSELPNTRIVDRPTRLKMGAHSALLMPYYHDVAQFEAVLDSEEPCELLVMHQGVSGFDYGNGRIAEQEEGVIPLRLLKRFKKVISGHFHAYQEKGNLVFLGTPFSHSFGESNQEKYIGIFHEDSLELELIETPFPRHVTIELACGEELADSPLGAAINHRPRDLIRAVLTGSQESILRFPVGEYPTVKFIEKPDLSVSEISVSETDSNELKFKKWAEEIKGLDPETIALGLEILGDLK